MMRTPCANLGESEVFYSEKLGLSKIFGSETDGFIDYQLDNIQLLLEIEEKGEFGCGKYLGFSMEVEDISSYFEQSKTRGIEFTGPPQKQDWGGLMTHIIDSSQNTFSIVQVENVA